MEEIDIEKWQEVRKQSKRVLKKPLILYLKCLSVKFIVEKKKQNKEKINNLLFNILSI